jgi:hypothetical protein
MPTDQTPTPIPTVREVEALRQAWWASSNFNTKNLNAYNAAKATVAAASDTLRILTEAIAARDAARVAAELANNRWHFRCKDLLKAKDDVFKAHEARNDAYTTVREAADAVSAARVAHSKATR